MLLAAFMLMKQFGLTGLFNIFPMAEAGMGYGMIFVTGLLTSVHCVAMCGGIYLSQCVPGPARGGAAIRPSLLYNLGRVAAYTAVGFIVGALGRVVTFSAAAQGGLKLAAGAFMVLMGLNMFGAFPQLRRLAPRFPGIFTARAGAGGGKSPLVVGLLNGLMPCGPLQAMQIYALSTGSPARGALSMLLFSLGTVPLMFGIGALSSALSKRFTRRAMAAGAALVALLGVSMLSQGWALAGFSPGAQPPGMRVAEGAGPGAGGGAAVGGADVAGDGAQLVGSTLEPGSYPAITVQSGTPVRWVIQAPEGSINGCNYIMRIPEYGLEHQFETGENIIEFTPDRAGKFIYSCWMGMIRGSITVVDASGA
jgi:sulfite exporter TauE/SafE